MRRTVWLGALALVAITGCRRAGPVDPTSEQPDPIVIGAVFPLSGGAGRIGEMKREGADLAVAHLNADGGILGRPLELSYADSKNSAVEAGVAFNKLVEVDGVPAVMSAMSQISLALAPLADRRQVVLFANASHPALPGKSPFVFRNLPSTRQTATTMAETAYRDLDLRRVAVMYVNDEYGAEAYHVFERQLSALGGEVVGAEPFEIAGTDFRSVLSRLAAQSPDGWWIPGYGAALGLVLKQKTELMLPGLVMCDLGLVDDNVIQTAAGAADGAVVVAPSFAPADPREAVQRFVSDFQQRYSELPSFDAAFQYDAVYLLADAMRRASALTGPAIQKALADTSGFVGVCGPTTFDADGDAELQVVVRTLFDGRLQPLEKLFEAPPPLTDEAPTDETSLE